MSSNDPASPTRVSRDPKPGPDGRQPVDLRLDAGLYVVSTPIGNLRDVTLRALDTLSAADEILAEDTRTARKLLDAHGISGKVTPYHDHNGAQRRPELLEKLEGGAAIALISDAGTPLVSDPGYKLVREAAEVGIRVVPVPGASALLAGLVMAGLPSDRFLFAGFLPPKSGARKKVLEELARVPATLVFYETGPRLTDVLADMSDVLGGDRAACVAREITKLFEEARRAPLAKLAEQYADEAPPKGEIVVLVGPPGVAVVGAADLDAALLEALAELPTKQAANQVAEALGIPKREAYQRALALKADGAG
ncbi:MAG: 16S rRNA (cytidine(1402)-2'-O)-methyltransferase [Hyphomonadaceae bacterium]|nr:16S rRNA (cytidine(1402)-2'-O)-methyltransferase [Hyphomonadaceae bacterium]